MDQHILIMAALGRRFELGDLYNYRIDQILTEYRCESASFPSGTQTETGFKLKLMRPDSGITDKWQHMGLDEHLQASILAGLFETETEMDQLIGASHYVNAKYYPTEVTRTFIIRAINKKHQLDLPNFLSNGVATDGKLRNATHIVVGIAYGAEAYCVLAQNVEDKEIDDREKIAKFLNHVSSMMEIALEEKQDEAEFKEQFTNEEKKLVGQMKCRVYADHQIQPVRECGLFNAYKHCLKLVHQVENMEKSVPVVAVLFPLIIVKANEGLVKSFTYRDVDAGLVARCCKISTELDRVISTSESIHLSMKKMIHRPDFNQFTQVVSKFKDLLKISWRKSIVKARESENEDDREVERVAHIAETHPLFNISRLNQWLHLKKAEMEMVGNLDSINGITFLADKSQLEKKLAFSLDRRHNLVLCIPSLDQSSKEILCAMKNYVDKNTDLVAGDDDDSCDEIGLPWHMVTDKRKLVLDNIRELVDFVKKNKHLENDFQFFILPEEGGKKFGCSYSVYQADNLVKDNLTQLPTSFYNETDIGRSEFDEVSDTGSTLNINQQMDVEQEETIIIHEFLPHRNRTNSAKCTSIMDKNNEFYFLRDLELAKAIILVSSWGGDFTFPNGLDETGLYPTWLAAVTNKARNKAAPPSDSLAPLFSTKLNHIFTDNAKSSTSTLPEDSDQRQRNLIPVCISTTSPQNKKFIRQTVSPATLESSPLVNTTDYKKGAAVIPPILLGERQFCLDARSNLVEDPMMVGQSFPKNWTEAEKEIFTQKYLLHPKSFSTIASYLENKTVADCVSFYYLSKKTVNYKELVKKTKRKRKSRATTTPHLLLEPQMQLRSSHTRAKPVSQ